jgi:hypothetical protein
MVSGYGLAMLESFLASLMAGDRIQVSPPEPGRSPESALGAAVVALDAQARAECPGVPPALDVDIADRAIRMLYRASQILVFRDTDVGDVPIIQGVGPSAHWSVDLGFRHLPNLWKQARARAAGDPFIAWIAAVVRPWPLSAVGIPITPLPDPSPILDHPALAREYLDRCLAAGQDWLTHPQVRAAARTAIGAHPSLVPTTVASLVAEPSS